MKRYGVYKIDPSSKMEWVLMCDNLEHAKREAKAHIPYATGGRALVVHLDAVYYFEATVTEGKCLPIDGETV